MSETNEKTKKSKKFIDPRDGVEFINISSSGATELGRFLAVNTDARFNHPEYGEFRSVIGFWKWLCALNRDAVDSATRTTIDRLRILSGREATKHAKDKVPQGFVPSFRQNIAMAIWYKIKANESMVKGIIENELPFISVTATGKQNVLSSNSNSDWLVPIFTAISEHLKQNGIEVEYEYVYPKYETKRTYRTK